MKPILFRELTTQMAANQIKASLRLAPLFKEEKAKGEEKNRQENLVCFSMEEISAVLLRRGKRDAISFTVKGRRNALFSLCVSVSGWERVLCGRFDENGQAALTLFLPASRTRRWRIDTPQLYEVTAEILGGSSKKHCFYLGRAAYTRRLFKDGHLLVDGEKPLSLLGVFAEEPLPSLRRLKRAGVSLLLCPPSLITEALLLEADLAGLGISAILTVEKGDSLAALLADAEKAVRLKMRHPSLLYLTVFYGQGAMKRHSSVKDALLSLLRYHSSSLGLLHLEKRADASFYTDMPFAISETEAALRVKERYGVQEEDFRLWLYKHLSAGFALGGARYLLLPSLMQGEEGLALLCESGRVGFDRPTYFVRERTQVLFTVWAKGDLRGAALQYTLEKDGVAVYAAEGTVEGEAVPPIGLDASFALASGAYTLRLQVTHQGVIYEATATVLLLADAYRKNYKTHFARLPLGESRLSEAAVITKEERSFFLLSARADIPPLISVLSPFSRLSFSGEGVLPHLYNENGGCVTGLLPEDSCLINTLLLDDLGAETVDKEEISEDKNDFFENFF